MLNSKYKNSYKQELSKFLELFHKNKNKSINEFLFERIYDGYAINSTNYLENWFKSHRSNPALKVSNIPINKLRSWTVDKRGWIKHNSKQFFYIQGIRVSNSTIREVGKEGWDQPILTQVGYDGGIVGILRKKINNVPHYLIEAKFEPGNYGLVQMSPTLQATFSNIYAAHGGRKPEHINFFINKKNKIIFKKWFSEDGGRLFNKRNLGMVVEVNPRKNIKLNQYMKWMTLKQIIYFMKYKNAWVNPHLRSLTAVL